MAASCSPQSLAASVGMRHDGTPACTAACSSAKLPQAAVDASKCSLAYSCVHHFHLIDRPLLPIAAPSILVSRHFTYNIHYGQRLRSSSVRYAMTPVRPPSKHPNTHSSSSLQSRWTRLPSRICSRSRQARYAISWILTQPCRSTDCLPGTCAVGVKGDKIVVLGCEKRSAMKLQDTRITPSKIGLIDNHVCLAFAGLNADARILVDKARLEAQSHRLTVEDPVSIEYITKHVAQVQQRYTQSGGVRPFGISTLIVGFDPNSTEARLFYTEPSGIYSAWFVYLLHP